MAQTVTGLQFPQRLRPHRLGTKSPYVRSIPRDSGHQVVPHQLVAAACVLDFPMILLLGFIALFFTPQLNPALTPQKAPKPQLPRIDQHACPFEGCQFGKWTAREPVHFYSTWKSDRKLLRTIAKGETVTAVSGIYVTYEPAEIEVTAPMPGYKLKPGDKIYGYMSIGEGFFNAWFNGYWVEEFDGSSISAPDGSGCRRNCTARLLKPARAEWWVQIKTRDGTSGWTKEGNKFDGSDSLALLTALGHPTLGRRDQFRLPHRH